MRTANLLFRCEKKIIIAKCAVDERLSGFCAHFVKNSEIISLVFFKDNA